MLAHLPCLPSKSWASTNNISGHRLNCITHKNKHMKNSLRFRTSHHRAFKKAFLIMKISFLLIWVTSLHVSANVNGQSKISLKLEHTEISYALNVLEKQSNYRFLYNSRLKDLQQKINIDVSNLEIKDVLNKIFTGTDLTYKLLETNLIVVLSGSPGLQDIKITGRVTGENGEALSGVSVTLKGTGGGTTTDNNGNFTLTVPENGTLVISYVGY